MAKIGKISSHVPSWQKFDPTKAKLTKNQKAALKRKELQQLCRDAIKNDKLKYAFYQVNWFSLPQGSCKSINQPPTVKAISRFA